jgi:hypothetical protein
MQEEKGTSKMTREEAERKNKIIVALFEGRSSTVAELVIELLNILVNSKHLENEEAEGTTMIRNQGMLKAYKQILNFFEKQPVTRNETSPR